MKADNKKLLTEIIKVVEELKGEDVSILDFTEKENSIAEYFVICTATSNTHVDAISNKLEREIRKSIKERPMHTEGVGFSNWVLVDYVNVVVHIFTEDVRDYYNLESLWGDVKKITL